jgi:hypothetical protein
VNVKIKKCYCPPQELEGNPVIDCTAFSLAFDALEFAQSVSQTSSMLSSWQGGRLKLSARRRMAATSRPAPSPPLLTCCRVYTSIEEVKKDYVSGALHPGDAKSGLGMHT